MQKHTIEERSATFANGLPDLQAALGEGRSPLHSCSVLQENDIPVVVFNLMTPGNISRAVLGNEAVGTTVNSTAADESRAAAAALQGSSNGSSLEYMRH